MRAPGRVGDLFTGSTRTGGRIAAAAAPVFKKVSLEMGARIPPLSLPIGDFDETLAGVVRSAFLNQGEICLCGSRLFVERPLYARFKAALVEKLQALRPADPLLPTTEQGAVVSSAHLEKILGYIELARQEGGQVLTGGKQATVEGRCKKGWFIELHAHRGAHSDCRTNQEEIFGPVASLTPFDSESEVLAWANGTRYGLAASVWTRDLSRAHRFSAALASGIIWVNCWMVRDLRTPFGGVKDSGVGREGGLDVFRFVTEPRNICVKV